MCSMLSSWQSRKSSQCIEADLTITELQVQDCGLGKQYIAIDLVSIIMWSNRYQQGSNALK